SLGPGRGGRPPPRHGDDAPLPAGTLGCAARHALQDVSVAVLWGLGALGYLRRCGHHEHTSALLALLVDLHRQVHVLPRTALRAGEPSRGVQGERRGMRLELEALQLARRRAAGNPRTVDAKVHSQGADVVAGSVLVTGRVAVGAL